MIAPAPADTGESSDLGTLAAALSVAVRIEPELIRAVRLEIMPTLDVASEADLWFSGWVSARQSGSIVFRHRARRELQATLTELLRSADPQSARIWRLGKVIANVHAQMSPALRLEEKITWLAISRGESARDKIEDELRTALSARAYEDRRRGIDDWFAGAILRLPELVRNTKTAWVLQQVQTPSGTTRIERASAPVSGLSVADLADVVALLPDTRLAVQRRGGTLEFGAATPEQDAVAILVPDTSPRIVELLAPSGAPGETKTVEITAGQTQSVPVDSGPVRIRTARGLVYEIPGVPKAGTPGRIFLSHSSHDNRAALALKRWLTSQDPALSADEIFLKTDPDVGLPLGQRWSDALRQASYRCEAVICLVSRDWLVSKECFSEYRVAETLGKQIVIALLEDIDDRDVASEWRRVELYAAGNQTMVEVPGGPPARFNTAALHLLLHGIRVGGIGPESFVWPPRDDPDRAPYRGWRPFDDIDAGVFFGRDEAIGQALDDLRSMRLSGDRSMFVVLGPSGCGKSSFLRAGLIPRLHREDRRFMLLGIMRPERHALTGQHGFAAALSTARNAIQLPNVPLGEIKTACRREDVGWLSGLLGELSAAASGRLSEAGADGVAPTLVLPLDQAEELFGADADPEAEQLLRLIAALTSKPSGTDGPQLVVAATIRADRYTAMQNHIALAEIRKLLFELKPLPPSQFATIITKPAERSTDAGRPLSADSELVNRLLEGAADGANALPLLALMLSRLYEDSAGSGSAGSGRLTAEAYSHLGGMGHVLRSEIDHMLSVEPRERKVQLEVLRSAFIPWLTSISADTDQPTRRVARWSELPEPSRPLIEALVARRLLVTDEREGEVVVEVAIDSLLRHWNDLVDWLTEEREGLKTATDIKRMAAQWESHDREETWLLTGTRLADAEELTSSPRFAGYLADVRDYLDECRRHNDRGADADALVRSALRWEENGRDADLLLDGDHLTEAEVLAATGGLGDQLETVRAYLAESRQRQRASHPAVEHRPAAVASRLPFTRLSDPRGVAVDGAGNIYVADSGNDRIVKLGPGSAAPTTLPLSGVRYPSAVAVDTAGNVYVADSARYRVVRLDVDSMSLTTLPFKDIGYGMGVAVDSAGSVYICGGSSVQKLPAGSAEATRLPPLSGPRTPEPRGLAVDGSGTVYITDFANNRVLKLVPGADTWTEVSYVGLDRPEGAAVDASDALYVTDFGNNRVLKLTPGSDTQMELRFGEGDLTHPAGVAVDAARNVYVTNTPLVQSPPNYWVVKLPAQ
jgi:sugar lactone lactonase YvrE